MAVTVDMPGRKVVVTGTMADLIQALLDSELTQRFVQERRCFELTMHVSPAEIEIVPRIKLARYKRGQDGFSR